MITMITDSWLVVVVVMGDNIRLKFRFNSKIYNNNNNNGLKWSRLNDSDTFQVVTNRIH